MKFILFALFLMPLFVCAQEKATALPVDSSTNQITYTEVVKVDSVSASELYSRAKLFVADYYKSSKDVTQLNDDDSKTILIKPLSQIVFTGLATSAYSGNVQYQLKMEMKDGRYRYRLEGFGYFVTWDKSNRILNLSEPKMKGLPQKIWNGILEQTDANMQRLIAAMKKAMNKSPNSDF